MATLSLSAQVMFDLYLMCCVWEWEVACKKAGRDDGDTVRPVNRETPFQRFLRSGLIEHDVPPEDSPFKYYRTTVDKVFRILNGMGLITELQVKSMRSDRELQNLFYRRSKHVHSSDAGRQDLAGTKEMLILHRDMRTAVNKKRLTRDVYYYPTANGQTAGRAIAERYKEKITKDAYCKEIARQEAEKPKGPAGMAAVSRRYRAQVEEETRS